MYAPSQNSTDSPPFAFPERSSKVMDRRIQFVVSLIDSSFSHSLSTSEAARLVNLSQSRLSHLFKAETGKTFSAYLTQRRIESAHGLLGDTCLSVKQIMNQVGISDGSHFVQAFRKEYGVAPSHLRNIGDLGLNSSGPLFRQRLTDLAKKQLILPKVTP
jgi:transcriptional regulator GlxA family with amidase domain